MQEKRPTLGEGVHKFHLSQPTQIKVGFDWETPQATNQVSSSDGHTEQTVGNLCSNIKQRNDLCLSNLLIDVIKGICSCCTSITLNLCFLWLHRKYRKDQCNHSPFHSAAIAREKGVLHSGQTDLLWDIHIYVIKHPHDALQQRTRLSAHVTAQVEVLFTYLLWSRELLQSFDAALENRVV